MGLAISKQILADGKNVAVNLKSQTFMIQSVLPYMRKKKFGRIVNASSISGALADIGLTAYAATKAGIVMLTKIACGELAPYGMTVNAFAPGIIWRKSYLVAQSQNGHAAQDSTKPRPKHSDNRCSQAADGAVGGYLRR